MLIYRNIINNLLKWQSKPGRLPLILRGVRQVGKSEMITSFGRNHFPSFLRVDLERDQKVAAVFRSVKDPKEIIEQIQIVTGNRLHRSDLLFIDEIQACPPALTSLKYFAEDMPGQAVVAAGSLLGVLLAGLSDEKPCPFPVGKVEFMDLPPVTFDEFAVFRGAEAALYKARGQIEKEGCVAESMHMMLWDLWKQYLITGGLPEVITKFAAGAVDGLNAGFQAARLKQGELVTAYEADVAKHSGKVNALHVIRVLHALPAKLASVPHEGTRRFTFKDVVPGVRGYERICGAIDWLTGCGLAHRVPSVKEPAAPLKVFGEEHLFKLFLFDVGLLGALAGMNPAALYDFNFGMYKGYFAESFALQEMLAGDLRRPIVSWYAKEAEIEFLLEDASGIVPVEVKSSHKFRSRSLTSFEKSFLYILPGRPPCRRPGHDGAETGFNARV